MADHFSEEQWRSILDLSEAAAELPPDARLTFLQSTDSSPDVIREVLSVVGEYQPSAALPDRVGTQIGRFLITGHLGRGGVGDVYSARDTELERTVALKFLVPETIELHGAVERVIREARTASALNHPNIVTIHEVIRAESTVAIVMEFVEGAALRQRCGAPLPIDEVRHIGEGIAQALAAAHAAGIVHRDIKPENVIVRPDGSLKVLDFGLATFTVPREQTDNRISTSHLFAGTWRYMSPEQARGEAVSGATDIFSLGLVLYELCTGEHPFPADSAFETMQALISRQADRPSKLNRAVPEPLDSLMLAMLANDPAHRPSAENVAKTLAKLGQKPIPAATVVDRLPKLLRYSVFVVAPLLLAGVAAWYWKLLPLGGREPTFSQVTTLVSENRATAAAISPDGAWQAYANIDGIFVRSEQTGKTTALQTPSNFVPDRLAWFTGATKLVASGFSPLTNEASVWTVFVDGGPPRLLRTEAEAATPSPDGSRIAFVSRDQSSIWVMDVGGESSRQVVAGPEGDTFPFVFWSADGRSLAFQRRHFSGKQDLGFVMLDRFYERSYESIDLRTGRKVASVPNFWMNSATTLPDGRMVFLRYNRPGSDHSNELWEVKTDSHTGEFHGTPRKIVNPIGPGSDYLYDMSATADGKRITVLRRSAQNTTFVADFAPSPPRIVHIRRLTLDERTTFPHAWTADSKAVIFESDHSGSWDIWRQRMDQRTPESIVATSLQEVLPQLTPDGHSILYAASPPIMKLKNFKLMRIPVEGGTPQEVPIGGSLDEFRCAIGGGRCVIRTTVGHEYYAYYELDPLRGRGRELARTKWVLETLGDWDISPDGSQVAIPNHDPRSARIRVVPLDADSPPEHEIVVGGMSDLVGLVWASGGKAWFVSEFIPGGRQLLYVGLNGRVSPLGNIQGWAVPSPDGRRVAFVDSLVATNAWVIDRR